MHGSIDKSGKSDRSLFERWRIGFPAFPVLLAVALIGLAIWEPAAPGWIAEAAQTELAGIYGMPESAPTQLAGPSMEIRTVRAY